MPSHKSTRGAIPRSSAPPWSPGTATSISWNEGQQKALQYIDGGLDVFLTGPAGTGKTAVLEEAKRRKEKEGKTVTVCATTGLASSLLGGITLHRLLVIGNRQEKDPVCISGAWTADLPCIPQDARRSACRT